MPAYNEESRIEHSLRKVITYFEKKDLDFELIVVDDGSIDATGQIVAVVASGDARVKLLKNRRNIGKGYSVRHGIGASKGDLVLFCDADLSTPIEEFDKLWPWAESFDLVIASRSLPESSVLVRQPLYRELMGRIFNVFVRMLILRGIIDTQCGFKLMTRRAATEILRRQRIDSFSFDVELILIAKKLGFRIKEVAISWSDCRGSRVHPIKDSSKMLLDLVRIKLYDMLGYYEKGS